MKNTLREWNMYSCCFVMFVIIAPLTSLAQQSKIFSLDAVHSYLTAKTREEALKQLAPDFRLWFGKKEGRGLSKQDLAGMLEWDFALDPRHRIDSSQTDGRDVTAQVHEDNNFSLLLGFPGWDASWTFILKENGLIDGIVYVPKKGQADWKPYLEKALPWLKEHYPEDMTQLYPNNKLKQTSETARRWVDILRAWRIATKQPDPTLH